MKETQNEKITETTKEIEREVPVEPEGAEVKQPETFKKETVITETETKE